jgi:integrase
MARQINRLSATKVAKAMQPGMHADGGGLYLRISAGANSGKRWVFLYRRPKDGKRCEMGLGSLLAVSLARAREKAGQARAMIADGNDPLLAKQAAKAMPTFGETADQFIESMQSSWSNDKHRAQWGMTLTVYAGPIRDKPVDQITKDDVLSVVQPIWLTKSETASRLRGRIEKVLDFAKVHGFRDGPNPAAWRGHLALVLPPRPKLTRGHHARMAIEDMPAFMTRLREREAIAARCLEFAILTAMRTNTALGARWDEINLGTKVWTIPGYDPKTGRRMKARKEHRVPLSARALEILAQMEPLREGDHIFPGQRRGAHLSTMALAMVLRRMHIEEATVHGFRSTFRDWAGNHTSFPREIAELALAHEVGDKTERAYRRDDAIERRRPLMEAWSAFCGTTETANILPFYTSSAHISG